MAGFGVAEAFNSSFILSTAHNQLTNPNVQEYIYIQIYILHGNPRTAGHSVSYAPNLRGVVSIDCLYDVVSRAYVCLPRDLTLKIDVCETITTAYPWKWNLNLDSQITYFYEKNMYITSIGDSLDSWEPFAE